MIKKFLGGHGRKIMWPVRLQGSKYQEWTDVMTDFFHTLNSEKIKIVSNYFGWGCSKMVRPLNCADFLHAGSHEMMFA